MTCIGNWVFLFFFCGGGGGGDLLTKFFCPLDCTGFDVHVVV